MPANDHEAFEQLVTKGTGHAALDLLAYATFAFDRSQWLQLRTNANGGTLPTPAEIDTWIADIPPHQFDQMRSRAASIFDVAAREYMAGDIAKAKLDALETTVIREVKAAGGFWRQSFIALGTAILAPIIIGGVIVMGLLGEKAVPTITGVRDAIMNQQNGAPKPDTQKKQDGQQ
ncbi:hypothetical protein [Methylobacterium sp. Leaf85]|uniref:hypothetical protein n=1 Tax=Methylobacterium sp. Leaf85 TaxID=1736241 RepID=UPI0006F5C770|nr:hypothetical protein [Methylobacterium sp. Leaf85]KQO49949.1 hypothetical protein ASF08_22690 [Methylobacterium sp. Leaf85]